MGAAAVAAGLLLAPAAASAQPFPPPAGGPVEPYGANDAGGFRNVLPPGSNGLNNAPDFTRYQADGTQPRHSNDQLPLYDDLVFASPKVDDDIPKFFKDATFGIKPGDVESALDDPRKNQNPCPGATVLRDKAFGVPRVYAGTRAAAMCALGYVAAEDRLFLIDVLRNAGRAQLTTFIGGAEGNREMDEEQWRIAPYTERDLLQQIRQLPELYDDEGQQIVDDARAYVLGINKYIIEAKGSPLKMPVEYAAINKPQGPDLWKETDLIATASLVGGIFGKGGGRELDLALMLQEAQERFENTVDPDQSQEGEGRDVFDDFRRSEDEEAPSTAKEDFPYQAPPGDDFDEDSAALPDEGTVEKADVVLSESACTPPDPACDIDIPDNGGIDLPPGFGDLMDGFPSGASNALLVSGSETDSGRPQVVFGPQTGYFSPQILMEQEVHAPTLEARGASFPGVNLYVQLGRGPDYAWSATSAGQDIIDTYAVELCDDGEGYMFRDKCEDIEELDKTNVFNTNAADPTVGQQTLRTERTKLGLIVGRGKVDGEDVAFTQLRSTYLHEIDSARGFSDFNDPDKIDDLGDYQEAAHKIGYTFNWFYTDEDEIGYFNSGNNPERPENIDHNFPVRGLQQYEWRGFQPYDGQGEENTANYTPSSEHPQADDPDFLTSWNNKQAPEYRAADDNLTYGSVHRSEPLDDRILEEIEDGEMSLDRLVDAMEDAATVDLRGDKVLPWALEVIGDPEAGDVSDDVQTALEELLEWEDDGAHRRDKGDENGEGAPDGKYEHTDAIAMMDAWWPELVKAQFEPVLGEDLYAAILGLVAIDDPPNTHQGSSYIAGWYSFVEKDLRNVLTTGENQRQGADDDASEEDEGGEKDEGGGDVDPPGEDDPSGGDEGEDGEPVEGAAAAPPGGEAGGGGGEETEGGEETGDDEPDADEITAQDEPDAGEEGEPDIEGPPFSRIYCGGTEEEDGTLDSCRAVLLETLQTAVDVARENRDELYEDEVCDAQEDDMRPEDDQVCFDAIRFTPAGAVEQPLINWQNRPTFQQVVEILGNDGGGGDGDGNGNGDGSNGNGNGSGNGNDGGDSLDVLPPGLARPPTCLPASLALGRLRLGPAALGASPLETLLGAGLPSGSPRSTFRYCREGGGELLIAFSGPSGARLIASTAAGDDPRRVGPGDPRSAFTRAFPDAVRLRAGVYRASPTSRLVFGLTRSRVRFVGLADRRLLAAPAAALDDHLDRLGL